MIEVEQDQEKEGGLYHRDKDQNTEELENEQPLL